MKKYHALISFIMLLVSAAPGTLLAEKSPQMGVQQFSLHSLNTVAREVAVGNVMENIPRDFNGEINLVWTNARFAPVAQALRNDLIARGIPPYRISLNHDAGGYRENGSDGVQIYLQHIVMRMPECLDRSMNYRFDTHAELGCTLQNIRSHSLVNPLQFVL